MRVNVSPLHPSNGDYSRLLCAVFVVSESGLEDDVRDLEADLSRRHAKLCENVLRKCFERENMLQSLRQEHFTSDSSDILSEEGKSFLDTCYAYESSEDSFEEELERQTYSSSAASSQSLSDPAKSNCLIRTAV